MNEIFKELTNNQKTWLIDVRSEAEWHKEGIPTFMRQDEEDKDENNNTENRIILLSLYTSPNMEINANFLHELQNMVPKHDNGGYYFLCRSAHRSAIASQLAQEIGYKNCYSIAFSGDSGWVGLGLPVVSYTNNLSCN